NGAGPRVDGHLPKRFVGLIQVACMIGVVNKSHLALRAVHEASRERPVNLVGSGVHSMIDGVACTEDIDGLVIRLSIDDCKNAANRDKDLVSRRVDDHTSWS